jgi:hypothetical protein
MEQSITRTRYEGKTKTISTLILAGIAVTGSAYEPVGHKKALPSVVAEYISHRQYNPQKFSNDWQKSEERKQQLISNITGIRSDIRQMAEKLITTCASSMMEHSRQQDHKLVMERSKELDTAPKYIKLNILKQRKGIVTIEM